MCAVQILSKDVDYTGKYLRSHWDNELFVLYQLEDLLFCMSYSLNHKVYTMVQHTVDEVNSWGGFDVEDETPWWWNKEDLKINIDMR